MTNQQLKDDEVLLVSHDGKMSIVKARTCAVPKRIQVVLAGATVPNDWLLEQVLHRTMQDAKVYRFPPVKK